MLTNGRFRTHHQSEFATVAGGGGYQGLPNMRNESNFYPRENYDQRQGYYVEQYQSDRSNIQQQQLVRGGAQMPATPTNQGRVQEVQRFKQQSKPIVKSKQELGKYIHTCV